MLRRVFETQRDRLQRGLPVEEDQLPHLHYVGAGKGKEIKGQVRRLALDLFCDPAQESERKHRQHAYIKYNRAVRDLKQDVKRRRKLEDEKKKEYSLIKLSRNTGEEELWEKLKSLGPQEPVLKPVPMPVVVPPVEEFNPFFCHMKSSASRPADQVEFNRGVFYNDGRIDMCKQVVGPDHIEQLVDSIASNREVEHFLLGNNIVNVRGAKAIASLMRQRPDIKTWYLAGNEIDEAGAHMLASALVDSEADSLWLKRNPLMPGGVRHIAGMLARNKSIEILDLDNTGMFDDGCVFLFDQLRHNDTLKLIYMDANNLGMDSCVAIRDYMMGRRDREGIHSLYMGMNPLFDDGVSVLAEGIRVYRFLKRIVLSSVRMTGAGLKELLDAIEASRNPNLIVLDVGHYKSTSDMGEISNCFGDDGALHMAGFIRRNRTVQILDVRTSHLTLEGLRMIRQAIECNGTLRFVYADQWGFKSPSDRAQYREELRLIREALDKNCQRHEGMSLMEYWKSVVRFVKHGEKVRYIDSIYRNNM